ncbi:unnamed protein product [Nesidiocoris tenuis]|uniref:V-type proton ATPase subunit n=1 Tax=Nesidiocoris tenuis TaxID=355587 RepID=A0A6H5GZG1_9HEMI|nr:unnamed protein product [Nesidiocoris tenuis]
MAVSVPIVGAVCGFWAVVAFIVPWFIPKGPNRGVTQWCIVLSAICCWAFWGLNYLTQMNPLIGPKLSSNQISAIAREWVGIIILNNKKVLNYCQC